MFRVALQAAWLDFGRVSGARRWAETVQLALINSLLMVTSAWSAVLTGFTQGAQQGTQAQSHKLLTCSMKGTHRPEAVSTSSGWIRLTLALLSCKRFGG